MSLIILQPCGSPAAYQHYQDTILNKISLSDISKFIREDDLINLGEIYPEGDTQIWGVTPGKNNTNSWNLISRGDITLFSGKGKIFSSAITTYKLNNRELAQYLWGSDKKGETWEYIYFLDEVFEQNIPYSVFNKILGYSSNYVIQGFRHLDNKKSDLIINNFDLLSHTYTNPISVEEYSKLVDSDSLDTQNVTTSRVEQSFLRDKLFQRNRHATCCMCHKTFPVQFLVAAHLKKRSIASLEEKKDFNNIVAPMCTFGCDVLYERGYISVENGSIVKNSRMNTTSDLDVYIDQLNGKKCIAWNENTKIYFNWHTKFYNKKNL